MRKLTYSFLQIVVRYLFWHGVPLSERVPLILLEPSCVIAFIFQTVKCNNNINTYNDMIFEITNL